MSGTYVDSKVVEAAGAAVAKKARYLANLTDNLRLIWTGSAWGSLKERLNTYATLIADNPWACWSDDSLHGLLFTMEIIAAEWDKPNLTRILQTHGDELKALEDELYTAIEDNSRCYICGHIGGH